MSYSEITTWAKIFKHLRKCNGTCPHCCLDCKFFGECFEKWKRTKFADVYCRWRHGYEYCSEAFEVMEGEVWK